MVPYIYVVAYIDPSDGLDSLAFAHTLVCVEPGEDQEGRAYDEGATSGLIQRVREEFGIEGLQPQNDYIIPLTVSGQS